MSCGLLMQSPWLLLLDHGGAELKTVPLPDGWIVCIRCHLGWHCCTLPPQGQQPQQLVRGPSLAQLHHCSCMCVFELAGPDRPGLLAEVTHLLTWNWMRQQRHCLHSSRHRRSRRRCSRGRCTRCLTLRPWTSTPGLALLHIAATRSTTAAAGSRAVVGAASSLFMRVSHVVSCVLWFFLVLLLIHLLFRFQDQPIRPMCELGGWDVIFMHACKAQELTILRGIAPKWVVPLGSR